MHDRDAAFVGCSSLAQLGLWRLMANHFSRTDCCCLSLYELVLYEVWHVIPCGLELVSRVINRLDKRRHRQERPKPA